MRVTFVNRYAQCSSSQFLGTLFLFKARSNRPELCPYKTHEYMQTKYKENKRLIEYEAIPKKVSI